MPSPASVQRCPHTHPHSCAPLPFPFAGANKDAPLPVKLFEVSDVVLLSGAKGCGAANQRRLVAVLCDRAASFEAIHGLLNRVMEVLQVPFARERGGGAAPPSQEPGTRLPAPCRAFCAAPAPVPLMLTFCASTLCRRRREPRVGGAEAAAGRRVRVAGGRLVAHLLHGAARGGHLPRPACGRIRHHPPRGAGGVRHRQSRWEHGLVGGRSAAALRQAGAGWPGVGVACWPGLQQSRPHCCSRPSPGLHALLQLRRWSWTWSPSALTSLVGRCPHKSCDAACTPPHVGAPAARAALPHLIHPCLTCSGSAASQRCTHRSALKRTNGQGHALPCMYMA